jgi:hypothetical protein
MKVSHLFYTPEKAISDFGGSILDRDLDIVEMYSGVGSIHSAAVDRGLRSQAFDKHRVKDLTDRAGGYCEDVTSLDGFENAIRVVLRIRPGGMVTFALKCSSFISACASVHQRKGCNNWRGNEDKAIVQYGNSIANATAVLVVVAFLREVIPVLENPVSSKVWDYPEIAEAICKVQAIHSAIVPRCAYDDAPDGKRMGKKFRFLSNQSWITRIQQACPCKKDHVSCARKFVQQDTGKAKACTIGKERWSGIKDKMIESQSYPKRLGIAIVDAWLHHDEAPFSRSAARPACPAPRGRRVQLPGQPEAAAAIMERSKTVARSKTTIRENALANPSTTQPAWASPAFNSPQAQCDDSVRKPQAIKVTRKRPACGAQSNAPSWLQLDLIRADATDASPRAPLAKAPTTSAASKWMSPVPF